MTGRRQSEGIVAATRGYESWLRSSTALISGDLALKHQAMDAGPFPFLRATFYRFLQVWPSRCPEESSAPPVLAVGDLHVENFGTWRDVEGRLVWGVNDVDEAHLLPWTIDLVRLAVSARLVIAERRLGTGGGRACDAILAGYLRHLREGGRPYVLAEEHPVLRAEALSGLRDPVRFWATMDALPTVATAAVPTSAQRLLSRALPGTAVTQRLTRRVAGLGSLGHMRYTAQALAWGARLAREAKAEVPSAAVWLAAPGSTTPDIVGGDLLAGAVRCPDPTVEFQEGWVLRRLAPDCSRIEFADVVRGRDRLRLLEHMGAEAANLHLGTPGAATAIERDIDARDSGWLRRASKVMAAAVIDDQRDWAARRANSRPGRASGRLRGAAAR